MKHRHLRVVWGLFALFVVLFIVAPAVHAQSSMVFKGEDKQGRPVALRLFDKPCGEKVAQHLKPEFVPQLRAARLTWQGKEYESCWIVQGNAVHSIDETGELMQPIRIDMFGDDSV